MHHTTYLRARLVAGFRDCLRTNSVPVCAGPFRSVKEDTNYELKVVDC